MGYDGETLAFVEVRTRAAVKGKTALPELSITRDKHEVFVRTAKQFLREWHIEECPVRFDVVAIDNMPGRAPVVRLHKDALSPEIRRPTCRESRRGFLPQLVAATHFPFTPGDVQY
ncbi:MAG TPA: YraN family protein [Candidatus Acidoferrum sp.]